MQVGNYVQSDFVFNNFHLMKWKKIQIVEINGGEVCAGGGFCAGRFL